MWICGEDNFIRLYDLEGNLVKVIKIKLKNVLEDIMVIRNGELVYIDDIKKNFLNMVENKRIIKWISFIEWMFCSVCSIFLGDFLVILNSNSNM